MRIFFKNYYTKEEIKSREPIRICLLNTTANLAQFSRQLINGSISGPLNHTIVSSVMLTISIFVAMISLLLSEIMLLKSIYAWKWSVMAMKDDNLISLIILSLIGKLARDHDFFD